MKRSHLKRFSSTVVRVPTRIDASKQISYEIFHNKKRTLSLSKLTEPVAVLDDAGRIKYIQHQVPIPRTRHLSTYDPDTQEYIPSPRLLAKHRMLDARVESELKHEFWSGIERLQGFTTWNYFCPDPDRPEIRLYFNQNKWRFVEIISSDTVIFSNIYSNKGWAINLFNRGKIYWAGKKTFKAKKAPK